MKQRLLIEFDKAGAEWVVVAYLSGDGRMIDICERGVSPHPITGNLITGAPIELILRDEELTGKLNDPVEIERVRRHSLPELYDESVVFFLPRSMSIRQCGKKANHGLNYMEGKGTFALTNEIDESDAAKIIHYYTRVAYPSIPLWWESIKRQLKEDRTLVNCFDRRRTFYDQWGNDLFKQAVAFIPQSTVADMVLKGMRQSYEDPKINCNWDLGTNVYDSLLFQVLFNDRDWKTLASQCIKVGLDYMNAKCEYGGREFSIGTEMKIGLSWGKMVEVKLSQDVNRVANDLRKAWGKVCGKKQAA